MYSSSLILQNNYMNQQKNIPQSQIFILSPFSVKLTLLTIHLSLDILQDKYKCREVILLAKQITHLSINNNMKKVLISGAYGQVGLELYRALSLKIGPDNIICTDLRPPPANIQVKHHYTLDALNKDALFDFLKKHQITEIYSLAALLSATGEVNPLLTQKINMDALFNTLQAGREGLVKKIFWPSSIAAFGSNSPKRCPQLTIQQPNTVYGITKKAGQLWCNYYFNRYGVDVRSLRYPGLIGYRSAPGGGTTDYAVDIYHKAIMKQKFSCYLSENTPLPMIYTDDAIDATIQLMDAKSENLTVRTSYNLHSMTFTPKQIAAQITKVIPGFTIDYQINPLKQKIAQSWPSEFIDEEARRDWGWKPKYDLAAMTREIINNLTPQMIRAMRTK